MDLMWVSVNLAAVLAAFKAQEAGTPGNGTQRLVFFVVVSERERGERWDKNFQNSQATADIFTFTTTSETELGRWLSRVH